MTNNKDKIHTDSHPQYKGTTAIDEKRCTGCGTCVKVCPSLVLVMDNGKAFVDKPYYCVRCGHCGSVCPEGAIGETSTEEKILSASELKKMPSPDSLQLLFRSRRSVRHYRKKPIRKKDMDRILEAGRYTATGTNSQNVRYLLYDDPVKIQELNKIITPIMINLFKLGGRIAKMPFGVSMLGEALAERMKDLYLPGMDVLKERLDLGEERIFWNSPALLMVYAEKLDDTASFSCSAALYNCSLMAHTLGIGCCFNGFLQTVVNNKPKIKKMLGIPKYMKCYGVMTMGYQDIKFNRLVRRNPVNIIRK